MDVLTGTYVKKIMNVKIFNHREKRKHVITVTNLTNMINNTNVTKMTNVKNMTS